jgi:L-ascorbate metabolism protein UlaG (beta-lactamase superfamily)
MVFFILKFHTILGSADLASSLNHYTAAGFKNPYSSYHERSFFDIFKWMIWDRINGKRPFHPDKYDFGKIDNNGEFLRKNHDKFTVTWVGHSTLLIQIKGVNILTDPIWSDRASPFSFAGPKRYTKPGISLNNLPQINIILISHSHYDHFDLQTIDHFGDKVFYLIPLGMGKYLDALNITHYREMDWWDHFVYNGVDFYCTPAQHESGRFDNDDNKTLWCGWVAKNKTDNIYFAGDTGYFAGFKEIGRKYGPFNVAALPIGAYLPRWFMSPVHIGPSEAIDAMNDLNAKNMLAIHWGTFDLADEPLDDPPKTLNFLVEKRNLDKKRYWIFKFGETRVLE